MTIPDWLDWAQRLQAIAQTGLSYEPPIFDRERYDKIQEIAAEMLAANAGLGYMILQGRQFARADIIILGIVVIGVIGVIFTSVLGLLEKKVLRWKR